MMFRCPLQKNRKNMMENEQKIVEQLRGICETYRNQPQCLNFFDDVNLNENAHTRILKKFFSYRDYRNRHIFLEDWLHRFLPKAKGKDFSQCHFKIMLQEMYIDLAIECYTTDDKGQVCRDFAIIIENKCCDAPDGINQASRYICLLCKTGCKNRSLKPVDIGKYELCKEQPDLYFYYLTNVKKKKISETILPQDHAKVLGKDRLLYINYKDDILPWLKQLPVPTFETFFYCTVQNYIIYLTFWLTPEEKPGARYLDELFELIKKNNENELQTLTCDEATLKYIYMALKDKNDEGKIEKLRGKVYLGLCEIYCEKLFKDYEKIKISGFFDKKGTVTPFEAIFKLDDQLNIHAQPLSKDRRGYGKLFFKDKSGKCIGETSNKLWDCNFYAWLDGDDAVTEFLLKISLKELIDSAVQFQTSAK